jgi:uncharacterized protein YjbI with pentapeptide repeats
MSEKTDAARGPTTASSQPPAANAEKGDPVLPRALELGRLQGTRFAARVSPILSVLFRGLLIFAVPLAAWVVWFHPTWTSASLTWSEDWTKHLSAVAIVVPGWLLLLLWRLPKWQVEAADPGRSINPKDRADLEDTFRKTFAQVVAGIGAAGALYFTFQSSEAARRSSEAAQQSTETARETQITEEYAKAVEQLGTNGKDKLAVRLGGIYALERIANGSAKDHKAVIEVLTAYVRDRAKRSHGWADQLGSWSNVQPDVQAILTILCRRRRHFEGPAIDQHRPWPNLDWTDLTGADLQDCKLAKVSMQDAELPLAKLHGADLRGADLVLADLYNADLRGANLRRANLYGAHLSRADLEGADLRGAKLHGADLFLADLRGAKLRGADLRDAKR